MTDQGGYVLGLLAIISGLAISTLISNLHHLIVARRQVRWDWLLLSVAAFVTLNIVAGWWTSWRTLRSTGPDVQLWQFVLILAQLVALYLTARAVLPEPTARKNVDLAAHYEARKRYIWTSFVALYALLIAAGVIKPGISWPVIVSMRDFWLGLVLAGVLAMVPSRRVHAVLVPLALALSAALTLTMPLGG
jgi:uncharacterized membrane protein